MMTYRIGSRGEMVLQIQKALAGAGLNVIQDGIYGVITEESVKEFQKRKGITADGIVGPKTLALLIPCRFRKSKRVIKEIIIHCTATPEGQDKTVDQLRYEHTLPVSMGGRGWSDIGYHYVVYRNGHVMIGRDVDKIGAHCAGHNAHSIGVAYVGGVENKPGVPYLQQKAKDTRTLAQKAALMNLLIELREIYPKAEIHGHCEFANKPCPCFDARKEYANLS